MQDVTSPVVQRERKLDWLGQKLYQHLLHYGYQFVETNTIQDADLFLIKAGDQIISRLFTFERQGRQLALRPEFTALAARLYSQKFSDGTNPVKRWQFRGLVFEDDPAAVEQTYSRPSAGAELFGVQSFIADAEILGTAVLGLEAVGMANLRIELGHVGLTRHLLDRYGLDNHTKHFLMSRIPQLQAGKAEVLEELDEHLAGYLRAVQGPDYSTELNTQRMLDVLLDVTQRGSTMGGRTRHDIVRRLVQKHQRATEHEQVVRAIDFLVDWCRQAGEPQQAFQGLSELIEAGDETGRKLFADWQQTVQLLGAFGVQSSQIQVRPDLARSWDYYTGIVFNVMQGDDRLAGGGRYDELVHLVGSEQDVPAVGFAYDLDEIAKRIPDTPSNMHHTVQLHITEKHAEAGIVWAQRLRTQGMIVDMIIIDDAVNAEMTPTVTSEGWLRTSTGRVFSLDQLEYAVNELRQIER